MGRQTKAELEEELAFRDQLLDQIADAAVDDSLTSKQFRDQVADLLDEDDEEEENDEK